MSLTRLNLVLLPSVLALASPGWAEARQAHGKATQAHPLNLSLPPDVVASPGGNAAADPVQRNLRAPAPLPGNAPAHLRYGAGYELRQMEIGGAAPGGGAAAAGGGAGGGAGRHGR
ncbi:hypothetical protein [Thiobacillus sedimenti]|uniref:Uncharacterized protein n=1 Tax=Thiobacillus sedimenti TaxID=3110231 RepID=A0ABZ1CM51_9PROT|nr:hypothetical protein [Thiobacillus sp. SCUT-2]WRS40058.1 hypothetical protein VA613_04105 [Thiobacillus sp. SCUT-2]